MTIGSTDDVVRRGAPIIWRGKSVLANDDVVRSQQRIPVSVGARDICKGNSDFDFAAGRGRLDRLGAASEFRRRLDPNKSGVEAIDRRVCHCRIDR